MMVSNRKLLFQALFFLGRLFNVLSQKDVLCPTTHVVCHLAQVRHLDVHEHLEGAW